ncbi:HD-GYP domain-containing protein [Streptomyces sp. NPDC057702]|uniref:HD-GYP domain-containing protein n=1 Tax=unclassified Streptomyces TaxID=2593676 RepID=UPI0036789437
MRALPQAARLYIVGAVCVAALCAAPALASDPAATLGLDPAEPPARPGAPGWLSVALLALGYAGCQAAIRRAPRETPAAPTSGPPFDWGGPALLAGAFLLPPATAALATLPGALVVRAGPTASGGGSTPTARGWHLARLALAAYASATAFAATGGPTALVTADLPRALAPAAGAVLACWLSLTGLEHGARRAAGRRGRRWDREKRRDLGCSGAAYVVHGLVGLVMAVLWHSPYGPPAALLVLVPIALAGRALGAWPRERVARQRAVHALTQAVDLKDRYTRGHGERVGEAAVLIARELGMGAERLEVLRVAGVLHDVGKLGVPTRVLCKNGPLTPGERRVIELHPEHGDAMVRGIACLDEARTAVLHHHERLDGSGYPHGLAGRDIPEVARVVAVADAFDAMTSTRSYRRARPVPAAVEELRRCAGSQFDPRMVRALARALDRHGWETEAAATAEVAEGAGATCARVAAVQGAGRADAWAATDRTRERGSLTGAAGTGTVAGVGAGGAESGGGRGPGGPPAGGHSRDRQGRGRSYEHGDPRDPRGPCEPLDGCVAVGAAYPGAAYGPACEAAYDRPCGTACRDRDDAARAVDPHEESTQLGEGVRELWGSAVGLDVCAGSARGRVEGWSGEVGSEAAGESDASGRPGARALPYGGAARPVTAAAHAARRARRSDGRG